MGWERVLCAEDLALGHSQCLFPFGTVCLYPVPAVTLRHTGFRFGLPSPSDHQGQTRPCAWHKSLS